MQLYKRISELNYETTKVSDIKKILSELGIEQEFMWIEKLYLVKFVFYFVHAYSFESKMMDTKSYSNSLSVIEGAFRFDFNAFRAKGGDEFDEKYQGLIQWYLLMQKNRDFELLMTGHLLYKQMISASSSMALIKKTKDTKSDIKELVENIDYDFKYNIFINCLSLNEKLSVLEDKLSSANSLISAVDVNTTKRQTVLKIEDM